MDYGLARQASTFSNNKRDYLISYGSSNFPDSFKDTIIKDDKGNIVIATWEGGYDDDTDYWVERKTGRKFTLKPNQLHDFNQNPADVLVFRKKFYKESEDMRKENVITINEDVRIPGTDVVLEKGDMIQIVKEKYDANAVKSDARFKAISKICKKYGYDVEDYKDGEFSAFDGKSDEVSWDGNNYEYFNGVYRFTDEDTDVPDMAQRMINASKMLKELSKYPMN